MTTLHPDILKACAAYLAHADAYCLDEAGQMALLRPTASPIAFDRGHYDADGALSDNACDELTHAHIDAIRRHGQQIRVTTDRIVRTRDIALAILDATPSMLAWWCERLER